MDLPSLGYSAEKINAQDTLILKDIDHAGIKLFEETLISSDTILIIHILLRILSLART
jgi:hypothetical protein